MDPIQDLRLYSGSNNWQKKVYLHMSEYLTSKGVHTFGKSKDILKNNIIYKGNLYKHLLTEKDAHLNFVSLKIFEETKKRFLKKAGDFERVKTNTASSQAYCFNLIIYLSLNKVLANKIFSELIGKDIQINELIPEFTPCNLESIGDQGEKMGTDSDIGVFYSDSTGKKGVLLIEFKFIEAEFSVCGSYKAKNDVRSICNSNRFYQDLIEGKRQDNNKRPLCGYTKYDNWELTENSKVLNFQSIKNAKECPFKFGLNQLWRNMLLAENVAKHRNLNEFGFWVFSPKPNDEYLWDNGKTKSEFENILTEKGRSSFKSIYLEDIFLLLDKYCREEDQEWLGKMKEKYLIK